MRILHCFADWGIESEALSCYGEVVRVGLNPTNVNKSQPVQGDAKHIPFKPSTQFDLGLFHPPCTKWSDMPNANKDGEAENLIPVAREIAEQHCAEYIIENKPRAPLRDPVLLDGKMFGLPIQYERAFEMSFAVDQPPRQGRLIKTETSSFFYSERSREWWGAVKGIDSQAYPKEAMCKNCLPAQMVHYLVRGYLDATGKAQGPSDYSDWETEKDVERALETNAELGRWAQ